MRWLQTLWGAGDIAVGPLAGEHAPCAADIHAATFARPWTDGEIADLIGKAGVFGYAAHAPAARGATMAGFVLARAAADEAEILTIAVSPDRQGHGVGRRLMDRVLAHAHRERLSAVFLEVDEANPPARALYRRLGFAVVGGRPDYYRGRNGGRGGALVMRRDMAPVRKRR